MSEKVSLFDLWYKICDLLIKCLPQSHFLNVLSVPPIVNALINVQCRSTSVYNSSDVSVWFQFKGLMLLHCGKIDYVLTEYVF